MNSGTVAVAVEWALWGKESHDTGYRLLESSDGPVSPQIFVKALTRYSPGTLESLPQVTVSWLRDASEHLYVALAIHETAPGRFDAGGRQIVFTRYFCVRYEELAAEAVSYGTMYEELGQIRLGGHGRAMIKAGFPLSAPAPGTGLPRAVAAVPASAAPASGLAIRAAALLLTSRPVCILGADRTTLDVRLQFLDEVMSFLPYGMRSRLSASTRVSSTFQDHKLRLFFSSAPRRGEDHLVTWDQLDLSPIRHRYADDYLSWLVNGVRQPAPLLASVREPMGFSQPEILKVLERLHVSYGTPVSVVADVPPGPAPASGSQRRAPARHKAAAEVAPPDPEREMSVPEILISCGRRLEGGNPGFLISDLDRLEAYDPAAVTPQERAYYQGIIADRQLFRPNMRIKKQLQGRLYGLLLRIAFEDPLTYQGYCAIHGCAGYPYGTSLHRSLLLAINPAGRSELSVRLLGLHALGDKELRRVLRDKPLPPGVLIGAAANRELQPVHARVLGDIVISDLVDRTGRLDRMGLRQALIRHSCLAPALAELYPDRPSEQVARLSRLLTMAYGRTMEPLAVDEILANPMVPPTAALFAAVLGKVDPANAPRTERVFTRALISHEHFPGRVRDELLRLLPADSHLSAAADRGRKLHLPGRSAPPGAPGTRRPSLLRQRSQQD